MSEAENRINEYLEEKVNEDHEEKDKKERGDLCISVWQRSYLSIKRVTTSVNDLFCQITDGRPFLPSTQN